MNRVRLFGCFLYILCSRRKHTSGNLLYIYILNLSTPCNSFFFSPLDPQNHYIKCGIALRPGEMINSSPQTTLYPSPLARSHVWLWLQLSHSWQIGESFPGIDPSLCFRSLVFTPSPSLTVRKPLGLLWFGTGSASLQRLFRGCVSEKLANWKDDPKSRLNHWCKGISNHLRLNSLSP